MITLKIFFKRYSKVSIPPKFISNVALRFQYRSQEPPFNLQKKFSNFLILVTRNIDGTRTYESL